MFRAVPLTIMSFSLHKQQWYMSYRFADPARKLSAKLYDIYHCCLYSIKTHDGQRNCPKHVEFYSKNEYEKLMHQVGFIIGIYHHVRSPERQI